MQKRILIVGIHGFLGNALGQFFKRKNREYTVYGIALRPQKNERNVFSCDLNHSRPLEKILLRVKPGYIFNLAGGMAPTPKKLLSSNFYATLSLLEAIKKAGLKSRIIIPGSAAEYGCIHGQRLITEKSLPQPLGWYGFVKLLQTQLGIFYARQGLDVVVVRMFNICGAGTPSKLAIGEFARQIVAIERGSRAVIKTKSLNDKRDFCDIEDACRGLWMIAQQGKSGEIYNLCSGRALTMRVILQKMLRYSKSKGIRIQENRQDASFNFDSVGSNAKLKSVMPWLMRVSLERSLKNTLNSYRRKPALT